jgi:2-keto-3-deoxy-L-rhamnonate aldolase RhmA
MRTNLMKQRLGRGETVLGCSLMFPSPQVVEMLAYAGFHWVLLDCEHGSLSLADVEIMCMAADAAGITPIARPRSNSAADIQSVLDRGAHGVQVPHVNTADDARRAVSAVKFGPGAARGLAAGTRPDRWGLGAKMVDFAAEQNAQTLVAVQIEHADALPNVDDILRVPDIDVFFIGPSDLSQSLGHPGNPKAPDVARAIAKTLAKIKAADRTPGMPADATTLNGVRASGCRYIYTHLPKILGDGARAFLSES